MLLEFLIYPGLAFTLSLGLLYCGIFRKIAARMQNRMGPPVWQAFYDALKLFGKDNLIPSTAKAGFNAWPIVGLVSILVASLLMPIAGKPVLEGAADIVVVIYFFVLSSAALYMAGFSSGNPYATAGASRGFIQMIAYEAPFILSILFPVFFYGSLSLSFFNSLQQARGALAFEFPLAAMVFLFAVLGKLELPPFHIPAAHQELVGGYCVELSGFRLAMVEITHAVEAIALLAFGVALFFGGAGTLFGFVAKTFALLVLLAFSRALLARLRIEHALLLYWGAAGLLALDFAATYAGLL